MMPGRPASPTVGLSRRSYMLCYKSVSHDCERWDKRPRSPASFALGAALLNLTPMPMAIPSVTAATPKTQRTTSAMSVATRGAIHLSQAVLDKAGAEAQSQAYPTISRACNSLCKPDTFISAPDSVCRTYKRCLPWSFTIDLDVPGVPFGFRVWRIQLQVWQTLKPNGTIEGMGSWLKEFT